MCAGNDDTSVESRDAAVQEVYTVEDVVEKMGFGWYQLGITLFSGSLWVSKFTDLFIYVSNRTCKVTRIRRSCRCLHALSIATWNFITCSKACHMIRIRK